MKIMILSDRCAQAHPFEAAGGRPAVEVLSTMCDLASRGLTMIVVTHEVGFAREAADRVIFMDGGAIIEQGSPDEVIAKPSHPRTRAFLSRFV